MDEDKLDACCGKCGSMSHRTEDHPPDAPQPR